MRAREQNDGENITTEKIVYIFPNAKRRQKDAMGTLFLYAEREKKSTSKLKIDFVVRREFPIRETVQTGLRS